MATVGNGQLFWLRADRASLVNGGRVTAQFSVTLTSARPQPVTVTFATAGGTARAGADYLAVSGTLTFDPGETSKTYQRRDPP